MARARKKKAEQLAAEPTASPTEAPTPAPTPEPTPPEPAPEVVPQEVTQSGRSYAVDPTPLLTKRLTNEKDGPLAHLLRSYEQKCMLIALDEKPDQKYIDALKEAGFSYWAKDKCWKKRFMTSEEFEAMDANQRSARRGLRQIEAERLFMDIVNCIRADRGLEPLSGVGM